MTNSAHFASVISSEKIQDHEIMVSFDEESLFEGAVQAALRKLESDPTLADRTTLTPAQIANLLDFVLRSTYFQFNGSIYEQREGAAMGSPVSAVIANLYMETFEEQAIESAPSKPKIWKRYVDDTFTILDRDRVDSFLQHLNRPSASPWKPRTTTRSPFSTRQFQENQTAALPPASTGSQLTPINT